MPELPEVENIVLTLRPKICGCRIKNVEVLYPAAVKMPAAGGLRLPELVSGLKIRDVKRRGKYILIGLDDGHCLIFHLRMTGSLVFSRQKPCGEHSRLLFILDCGYLVFADIRKFGTVYFVSEEEKEKIKGLVSLGPEPFSDAFSEEYLRCRMEGKQTPVKSFLLNQENVAGIGNIYADEILFRLRLNPLEKAGSLGEGKRREIIRVAREVLREGIETGGASIRDYRDGEGRKGSFQERIAVYGKSGSPCPVCGAVLEKCRVAGRSSVFCPCCQKMEED